MNSQSTELEDERDEEVDPMMTINISAERGTRVSTPRPHASYCALVPSTVTSAVAPFGAQFGTTRVSVDWAGVRLDGRDTAMGHSAWSPPI